MAKKKISKKAYINLKIENCDKLILGATSDEQKEIYQGYREHWIGKLTEKDNPDIIAAKKLEKERLAAEKLEEIRIKEEQETALRDIEKQKEAEQAIIKKQIEDLKALMPEIKEEISETVELLEGALKDETEDPEEPEENKDELE